MDVQMINGLFSPADNQQHTQALQNLQQLRDSPDAWKKCAATLANGALDDKTKFVCLQVLEHYAKTSYLAANDEEQTFLRHNLSQWMSKLCLGSISQEVFIRNKTAQLMSLVFVADYLSRWPSLLKDLLGMQTHSPNAVDLYLKILQAIDAEIIDRETMHSQEETNRSTLLKDTMRERDVTQLSNSWFDILVKYEETQPELVCHCHDIIGAYISWIDINLIFNERFVCVFVSHMHNVLLREAAADCLHEILLKGMEPIAKMQLIESLYAVLDMDNIIKPNDDSDSDFLVKLSRLVNCTGVQLISAWQKLDKKDKEKRELIHQSIETKVPMLLQFMSSEYDDVSALTFDFARDYIQLIKQSGHLTDVERAQLESMLFIIITKTKYDESYNFDSAGEDEAIFDDYRKQLKVVFDNLAALVPDLIMKVCKDYVITTLNRWQSSAFEDVEAAVALLFSLGEAVPASYGNHFANNVANQGKSAILNELLGLLVSSGVSAHQHPAVALQYFECATRYEKFFALQTNFIPVVLEAFLDRRGMRNPSPKVRSRTSYLFSRFVRCLKSQLTNYTEQILTQLADLLVLSPPDNGQSMPLLSNDDQLYVYECAALLIVSGNSANEHKAGLMRSLLSPALAKVSVLTEKLAAEIIDVKKLAISTTLVHGASVTARTSKAFSSQHTMATCGCVPLYVEAAQLFVSAAGLADDACREVLCPGVRQLLHRLVVCLSAADLAPILPAASRALLHTPSVAVLIDYLPLINQITTKFKKEMRDFVCEMFPPLVSAVFNALAQELPPDDEQENRDRRTLHKTYFFFLSTVVNSGLTDVLAMQETALLQQILLSVSQGAIEFDDPSVQKSCFLLLKQLIETWGPKGPALFTEFLYSQVVPACFLAPLKCTFDLNDAQTLLALNESSLCLRALHASRGDELVAFLRTDYLPKMKLPPALIEEYCQALAADQKLFKNYTKFFFERVKS